MKKSNEATPLLRWIFRRGDDVLSCHVEKAANDDTYQVCVIPYGGVGRFLVERFDAGINAFHRHALIASQLRRNGWKLAAYA
jgi:hypothetical protein